MEFKGIGLDDVPGSFVPGGAEKLTHEIQGKLARAQNRWHKVEGLDSVGADVGTACLGFCRTRGSSNTCNKGKDCSNARNCT